MLKDNMCREFCDKCHRLHSQCKCTKNQSLLEARKYVNELSPGLVNLDMMMKIQELYEKAIDKQNNGV